MKQFKEDYEAKIRILKQENSDILAAHSQEMDKILKVETSIDAQQDRIKELEKELGRKNDEIELRKEVIDSMSASMMKHEKENRELVSKLVMLKNQMMEYDIGNASDRSFGAVKIFPTIGFKQGPPPLPVCMKIKKDKNEDYFLLIDSKQYEAEINFESIEEMEETDEEYRLSLTFLAPSENGETKQVTEIFECFEIDELLKIFHKIKTSMVAKPKSKVTSQKKPQVVARAKDQEEMAQGNPSSPMKKLKGFFNK